MEPDFTDTQLNAVPGSVTLLEPEFTNTQLQSVLAKPFIFLDQTPLILTGTAYAAGMSVVPGELKKVMNLFNQCDSLPSSRLTHAKNDPNKGQGST